MHPPPTSPPPATIGMVGPTPAEPPQSAAICGEEAWVLDLQQAV